MDSSVALESLEIWGGLVVTVLVVWVTVGFGGLEKSISEDSLSDEVDSDEVDSEVDVLVTVGFGGLEKSTSEDSLSDEVDSEVDEDAFALLVMVAVSVGLEASSSFPLPDDELSEEDVDRALADAFAITLVLAGLENSAADSLSDEEVPEEEELTDSLETGTLLGGCETAPTRGLEASFFTGTASTPAGDEASEADTASDSDFEAELEEPLVLTSRLSFFTKPLTVGFCEAAGICVWAPALSFSSSASLSALELDVDLEDDLFFIDVFGFLIDFCAEIASFISTSESASSPLLSLPLLLVRLFARTLAAAASLALASAFAFALIAFFDLL